MGVDRRGGNGLLRRRIRKTGAVITAVLLFFATSVFLCGPEARAEGGTMIRYEDPSTHEPIFYIEYDITSGQKITHESIYSGWPSGEIDLEAHVGEEFKINCKLVYPDSDKGLTGKSYIVYGDEPIGKNNEKNNASTGTVVPISFTIPNVKRMDFGITSMITFNSEGNLGGRDEVSISFHLNVVDASGENNITKETDADTNSGETGLDIPKTVMLGLGGLAAGGAAVAGAIAGSGNADVEDKKKYRLKVYKDFGDKIQTGQQYAVYARIVEVGAGGVEKDRPDLSAAITISSDDGVFDVQCGAGLSGNYKGAYVSAVEGTGKTEGRINFRYNGPHGSFTNSMRFFLDEPMIEFCQDSIALLAGTTEIAELGYYARGFDPEKVEITPTLEGEGSADYYKVKDTRPDKEGAPADLRFMLIGDKSDASGTPGTFSVTRLTITATEGEKQASGTINIYRVTEGLYIGSDRIACYRAVKKESVGKPVQNLTDADMEQSSSEIKAHILRFNEETHEVFYKPAPDMQVVFDAADSVAVSEGNEIIPPKVSAGADGVSGVASGVESGTVSGASDADATAFNMSLADKIKGLGITVKLAGATEDASVYRFFCTTGSLSFPHRYLCRMTATVTDPEDQKVFTTEQEMLLESQPYREHWEAMEATDFQMKSYLSELKDMIYGTISEVGYNTRDLNDMMNGTYGKEPTKGIVQGIADAIWGGGPAINNMTDSSKMRIASSVNADNNRLDTEGRTVFDKLAPVLSMIDVVEAGYDKHYGYDPIALSTIKYQIEETIRLHKRDLMNIDQAAAVARQETDLHDANSAWHLVSASFAKINEEHVDTWYGVLIRVGAGIATSGATEIIFTALDANKAAFKANEHKLLKDRSTAKAVVAGSIPVLMAAANYVGGKALADGMGAIAGQAAAVRGTGIRISAPASYKQGFAAELQRGFVKAQQGFENALSNGVSAVKNSSVVKGAALVGQGIGEMVPDSLKTVYGYAKLDVKVLRGLHYDPKGKCWKLYKAADAVDKGVLSAQKQAFNMIETSKGGAMKDQMCRLKSLAHDASELKAASTLDKYKKAVDAYRATGTDEAKEAMRLAYLDMQQDSLAINKLNMGIRTGSEIEKGVTLSDKYIEMFNKNQVEFLKNASRDDIKKGMMALAKEKGAKFTEDQFEIFYATGNTQRIDIKTGMDIDISPRFMINGKEYYFGQKETEEIVAKAWAKATGLDYNGNPTEFIAKLKGRAVTWEDPEFYREIGNVLKGNSVADISLQCNMKEGMYKLTHEYKKAQATFEAISSDAARYETAIKQIEQYQSRALSATELSTDAINLMESAQAQIECTHQFDKIRKIYENFNIKAMGSGAADGISEELRMIGQLTKQVENQGMHHINLGELEYLIKKSGAGSWLNASENLMSAAESVSIAAKGADALANQALKATVQGRGFAACNNVMNEMFNNLSSDK